MAHARSGLNGLHRPMPTKWRESYQWHRRAIGGTYRKSVGQMPGEGVEVASARPLVTLLARHEVCAASEFVLRICRVATCLQGGLGCTVAGRYDRSHLP